MGLPLLKSFIPPDDVLPGEQAPVIPSFDWAMEQMEILRDAELVREAQEFSAHGFWEEEDDENVADPRTAFKGKRA